MAGEALEPPEPPPGGGSLVIDPWAIDTGIVGALAPWVIAAVAIGAALLAALGTAKGRPWGVWLTAPVWFAWSLLAAAYAAEYSFTAYLCSYHPWRFVCSAAAPWLVLAALALAPAVAVVWLIAVRQGTAARRHRGPPAVGSDRSRDAAPA